MFGYNISVWPVCLATTPMSDQCAAYFELKPLCPANVQFILRIHNLRQPVPVSPRPWHWTTKIPFGLQDVTRECRRKPGECQGENMKLNLGPFHGVLIKYTTAALILGSTEAFCDALTSWHLRDRDPDTSHTVTRGKLGHVTHHSRGIWYSELV